MNFHFEIGERLAATLRALATESAVVSQMKAKAEEDRLKDRKAATLRKPCPKCGGEMQWLNAPGKNDTTLRPRRVVAQYCIKCRQRFEEFSLPEGVFMHVPVGGTHGIIFSDHES